MRNKVYITRRNRDCAQIWLEKIEQNNPDDNRYVIKSSVDWVLEYMRFIYEEVPSDALIYDFEHNGKKGLYTAIDPAGGPFINLGYEVEDYKIVRIYEDDEYGLVINLKDANTNKK
jgi:hypothetical protein